MAHTLLGLTITVEASASSLRQIVAFGRSQGINADRALAAILELSTALLSAPDLAALGAPAR